MYLNCWSLPHDLNLTHCALSKCVGLSLLSIRTSVALTQCPSFEFPFLCLWHDYILLWVFCCCWSLPSFVDQIHLAIVVLANSVGGPMIGSVANKKHILDARLKEVEPDEMLLKQWIYHVLGNFDWRLPLFPWQLFGKLICPLVSDWQWDKCLLSVVGAEQGHWTIAIFLGISGQTKILWIDSR